MRFSIVLILLLAATSTGIAVSFCSAQTATAKAADAGQLEIVRQLARQRGGQPAALAQIIQFSRGFDDAAAAEVIDELAQAHIRAGQLDLAATARQTIVERYYNNRAARESLLWLVRLYASSEVAYFHNGPPKRQQQPSPKLAAALQKMSPGADRADSPAEESPALAAKPSDPLAIYALHLASQAIGQNGALADDPALAFARGIAARRAGQEKSAAAFLSPLKHRQVGDPWGDAARAEAWLLDPHHEKSTKAMTRCLVAATPPHLDGTLDEPYWTGQRTDSGVLLAAATNDPPPTKTFWAYDREHLYVAIECPKLAGVAYPRDDRPRPRDGDVEAHDHVRLLLDVDRDYGSWFELAVDSRGWTADRCWGEAAWNPEWFVAAAESPDGQSWVIEAAIPWNQLAAQPPRAGEAWACAVERRPPAAEPAETAGKALGPERFALLLFE